MEKSRGSWVENVLIRYVTCMIQMEQTVLREAPCFMYDHLPRLSYDYLLFEMPHEVLCNGLGEVTRVSNTCTFVSLLLACAFT